MVDPDTVIFSNTRGFQGKRDEINRFIQSESPLVFLVAEHFQSSPFHLEISGYVLAALYCRNIRERGGVAIFVRAGVGFTARQDLDFFNLKKQFEVRSVEIPSRNLVVTVAYRPPSGRMAVFHTKLESILSIYNREPTKRHVMAGDFNVDNNNHNSTEKTLQACNFHFMLSSMTHESGKCLDNFIADFTPLGKEVMRQRFSDHCCIRMLLPESKDKKEVLNDLQSWKSKRDPEEYLVFNDYVADNSSQKPPAVVLANNSSLPSLYFVENSSRRHPSIDVADNSSRSSPNLDDPDKSSRRLSYLAFAGNSPQSPPIINVSDSSSSSPHSFDLADIFSQKPHSHISKVEIPSVFPRPKFIGSRNKMVMKNKTILSNETDPSDIPNCSLLELKGAVTKLLMEDDFLDKLVSRLVDKVKEKVAEELCDSLEDAKDQIKRLEDKVTILEAKIEYLEDNIIL